MKDFADFKKSLNNIEIIREIDKRADKYAKETIELNFPEKDESSKAIAYIQFFNEEKIILLLEKYHEWINE